MLWVTGQCQSVICSVLHFGPDCNISSTIGWIAVKFCADIHGAQMINPNDIMTKFRSDTPVSLRMNSINFKFINFGRLLTFHLASSGQHFNLPYILVSNLIPAKLMKVSYVLPFVFRANQLNRFYNLVYTLRLFSANQISMHS